MDPKQEQQLNQAERSGYFPQMRKLIGTAMAPLWWSAPAADGEIQILAGGTMFVLDTGTQVFGITNHHVYAKYLDHLEEYRGVECQFGGAAFQPERCLINCNKRADLATFAIPLVSRAMVPVLPFGAPAWPVEPLKKGERVILGGYPGALLVAHGPTVDSDLQVFALKAGDVFKDEIQLFLDTPSIHWPLHEGEQLNRELKGMSGGPVFRFVEAKPVDRVELVGIIFAETFDHILARPVGLLDSDGRIAV